MKTAVGALTLELLLFDSHSLKERRSVVNSIKERVRNRFNVSVAEVNFGDVWQRAGLIVTSGAESPAHVESTLQQVLRFIEDDERVQVMQPSVRYYE